MNLVIEPLYLLEPEILELTFPVDSILTLGFINLPDCRYNAIGMIDGG
jgi:hypothetical protein